MATRRGSCPCLVAPRSKGSPWPVPTPGWPGSGGWPSGLRRPKSRILPKTFGPGSCRPGPGRGHRGVPGRHLSFHQGAQEVLGRPGLGLGRQHNFGAEATEGGHLWPMAKPARRAHPYFARRLLTRRPPCSRHFLGRRLPRRATVNSDPHCAAQVHRSQLRVNQFRAFISLNPFPSLLSALTMGCGPIEGHSG